MKRLTSLLLATVFAAGFAVAANAKTLVFCSEGSPEGFDPGPYTTGTTMDASSPPVQTQPTTTQEPAPGKQPPTETMPDQPATKW